MNMLGGWGFKKIFYVEEAISIRYEALITWVLSEFIL